MLLSIITPWRNHAELIPDYENAVSGAQVIIIDNASAPDAAAALRALTDRLHGLYIRNEINAGFSGANNQGLARATGEIVLFLNNDIAAGPSFLDDVCRDTVEDCLVGPLLKTQVVYGVTLPYLEGWCLSGRRSAWQKVGGWDAEAYPQPYWEDNDLCLRALQAGLRLMPAQWPVTHKQGQTTRQLVLWGEVYERNRAVFAARVRPFYERFRADIEKGGNK